MRQVGSPYSASNGADDRRDVCVIGCGVVGASVSYHLAKHSAVRLTMVDVAPPGAGTTAAGTGWISPDHSCGIEFARFNLFAMEEHRRLSDLLPTRSWINAKGALLMTSPSDEGALHREVGRAREIGFPVEILDGRRVNQEMEPNLRFADRSAPVAYFPGEYSVNGSLLARLLVEEAMERGAQGHFGCTVADIDAHDQGYRLIMSDGTYIDADVIVNAAGANASAIASLLGVSLPMVPKAGMTVRVRAGGEVLGRAVRSESVMIKPEADGMLRLRSSRGWKSSDGVASTDNDFTGGLGRPEFAADLMRSAVEVLPAIEGASHVSCTSGIRPIPADGLPCVGEVPGRPGYFEIVTHNGAVMGPMLGRLLATEVATGTPSLALDPYRPTRFSVQQAPDVKEAKP